jgi:2-dehydropantoate 2-reductase
MDRPEGREIAFAVLDEVVATAGAYGISLDPGRMRAKVEHVLVHQREHKASMLQDIEAGRPTEIETINGAVVRAAAAKGVSTPVTQTLANLVRLIDQPSA